MTQLLQRNLKSFMAKQGVNASQLARKTGVKQPVVHRILSGETLDPKLGTVKAIADFFKISVNELVGDSIIIPNLPTTKTPLLTLSNVYDYLNKKIDVMEFF